MHTVSFVFEFLGTTELLVVALAALILFGPRKLPEIGRTLGKSIAEFKRASDDFKRTWEFEVELEQRKPALDDNAHTNAPGAFGEAALAPAELSAEESIGGTAMQPHIEGETIARTTTISDQPHASASSNVADEDEINAS
ncbi:MAG: sec-independent protein translocase protein TatB [Acidobacteriota bacterium]|jgi:TatA/E family protein of Tat protein translocase|nr:sec-independent protein translocase protein TatB [Acidobacteriota bacterium]